jgi:F-type H+-transporting ATPase subunit b
MNTEYQNAPHFSRLARLMAFAAPTVLTIASAFAADEPAHGGGEKAGVLPTIEQGIVPMVVTLVVFGIVLAILSAKVWPAISTGLADRENKIRNEIESAEMARKQAKDALEEYQKSLENARAESQKMLESTRAQQAAMAADLKAKADVELNAMRERAKRDIESAKRAAVAEIYNEASNLSTAIAEKILRRNLNEADQRQMVQESLAQMQR